MSRMMPILIIVAMFGALYSVCLAGETTTATIKVVNKLEPPAPSKIYLLGGVVGQLAYLASAARADLPDVDVRINGVKVGSVKFGRTEEFTFQPNKNGNNTFETGLCTSPTYQTAQNFTLGIGGEIIAKIGDISDVAFETTAKGVISPADKPKLVKKSTVKVELEESVIDKELFTESIEIVEGVVAEYELERSYEKSITAVLTTGLTTGGKAKGMVGSSLFGSAEVEAEVKAKIEASLSVTVGKKETFKTKITVDGNKTPKLKVVWVHRYRKGTVTLPDGKKEAFLVCVGVRWKLKKG